MKFDYNLILTIVAGILVCIPLVIKLVNVTREAVRSKNWYQIVKIVSELMQTAEALIVSGAEKKKYVLSMLATVVKQIDYEMTESDWQKVSDLIDQLAAMAKVVNTPINDD